MDRHGFQTRRVDAQDAPLLQAIRSEEAVSRWLRPRGERGPFSASDAHQLARADAAHWLAHGFGRWLVLDAGEPVGHGGLLLLVLDGRAEVEIAWAVAAAHWGRGIATAIGTAALQTARQLSIAQPVAFTRTDNAASRRVMEKIGLVYERELPYAGWPHVLYRAPPSQAAHLEGPSPGDGP